MEELRRIVKESRHVRRHAAVDRHSSQSRRLSATGRSIEEADRLGCALGVHGGAHENLGLDDLTPYAPVHSLGHPFGQMISFGGMIFNGVFDKFPNVKFGFMEGGVAWLLALPGTFRPLLGNPYSARPAQTLSRASAQGKSERIHRAPR